MNLLFPLIAQIPSTTQWGPQTAVVMILCNVVAIALAKAFMRDVGARPALPANYRKYFGGMGWPALLASTSLGHIFGIGTILGLANYGLL